MRSAIPLSPSRYSESSRLFCNSHPSSPSSPAPPAASPPGPCPVAAVAPAPAAVAPPSAPGAVGDESSRSRAKRPAVSRALPSGGGIRPTPAPTSPLPLPPAPPPPLLLPQGSEGASSREKRSVLGWPDSWSRRSSRPRRAYLWCGGSRRAVLSATTRCDVKKTREKEGIKTARFSNFYWLSPRLDSFPSASTISPRVQSLRHLKTLLTFAGAACTQRCPRASRPRSCSSCPRRPRHDLRRRSPSWRRRRRLASRARQPSIAPSKAGKPAS